MAEVLHIRVTPKAKQARVVEEPLPEGGVLYRVYVAVPPEDGKANAAMLKLLAAHLGVAPACLTLTHGLTSREKRVQFMPR